MNEATPVIAQLRTRLTQAERVLRSLDSPAARPRGRGVAAIEASNKAAELRECQKNLRNEVLRIEAALGRVDAGTFGMCPRCDLPIDEAQLQSDPTMPFCADCIRETHRRSKCNQRMRG